MVSGVGPPLIFLHGWGANLHTFDKLASQIKEDFTVYQIDLPGFGESEIKGVYSIEDYAEIINEFCLSLAIINPIILGHSFGGRVGLMYCKMFKASKLILVSTPGVKMRFNLVKWFKIKLYKMMKLFKLNIKMGSKDYKDSSGFLRGVLVKAINFDLTEVMKEIKIPTLLIYGKNDKDVPLYIGEKINENIKGSGLVVIDKCGHFPHIERFRYFLIVLRYFLLGDNG